MRSSYLVATVGRTTDREALSSASEYLLNLEGVETAVVLGIVDETVHLNGQSVDPRVDLETLPETTFGDLGDVSGHDGLASARIPLGLFSDAADHDDIDEMIEKAAKQRFFEEVAPNVS